MSSLADLPYRVRYKAAMRLLEQGAIRGEDALRLIVWPSSESLEGELSELEYCIHEHPRTPENTYVRKNGQRVCRVCAREQRPAYRKPETKRRRKPCATCGEPCYPQPGKTLRCRACFLAAGGAHFEFRKRRS